VGYTKSVEGVNKHAVFGTVTGPKRLGVFCTIGGTYGVAIDDLDAAERPCFGACFDLLKTKVLRLIPKGRLEWFASYGASR
jgi:hypothetical protein